MDYAGEEGYVTHYPKKFWAAIASVGWYLVAALVALCYASPYIQEKYRIWKHRKEEQEYAAKYHKNPDLLQERTSALEASRQQMQEKYYQSAQQVKEKEKERQEKKKEALRQADTDLRGHRLGSQANSDETIPLRGGYNPLVGDGSRGYRPPKRSRCGKGGCG